MKQTARIISTYSADVMGVCSALFELGGMTVMHDASGCNSTYTTHDEPRWYDMDSMVYISGISEMEAIMGDDEKLISDIVDAAEVLKPAFIAIAGTPIPTMTGFDFEAVAAVIEHRTGIPSFGFPTTGMNTYIHGASMAFAGIAERFVDDPAEKESSGIKVNVLGLTPLDFSVNGTDDSIVQWLEREGFEVVSKWAMGSSLDEIRRSAEADVNLVLSSTALDAARVLQERFGTPYVVGLPMGDAACTRVADLLKEAALTGESKILWEAGSAAETAKDSRTLIVGEPVYAASLRWVLEQGATCALAGSAVGPASDVQVLCPLEDPCGCLRDTDLQSWREPVIRAALAEADVIYADPLYRHLLPSGSLEGTSPKVFHDVPVENYSGRMYRDQMQVFLGPDGTR